MKICVCLDDSQGIAFNRRRQSRDSAVTERISEDARGSILRISPYSGPLFNIENIYEGDDYLENAEPGDWCFCERQDPSPYTDRAEAFVIYRWNRAYPGDVFFSADLAEAGFHLEETEEFTGSSHEKITREVYTR